MKISNELKSSGVSLHYMKHKGGRGVNGLQRHNERVPGQNHSNKNIDDSRTADNIFLKKCDSTFTKKINEIIAEKRTSKRKVRKDAVRMVEATVQFSGTVTNLPEDEQEQVLRDSYEWLKNEFGEDNIVSAVIHKDETSMHLHFDFVPMKDGSLSARKVLGKYDMLRQQADFLKYLQNTHPEAYFERGGGEFNGLRKKDFEKVQAMISANKAEMKEYEEALDDRSDKLDDREEILDISEKKLNQKAEKLSEKEENLDIREKMIVDAVGKIQSKDHELKQREEAVKTAEGFADKVNRYNQKRSEELDERFEAFERYAREEREKISKEAQKRSQELSERSEAFDRYVREEREKIARESQKRSQELSERSRAIQQRESKVAELFRLLEEKQKAFERLVSNTKKWVNSGLVKAKHVVNVVGKGLTRVDESKNDQKQVDTVNLLNGLTDLSLETPEPDVKRQAQKTAEQLNLDFTGLDARDLER